MKLTLRNLGRLREATINLDKDLILLTGPNNTSKTYVAHTIYGLGEHGLLSTAFFISDVLREKTVHQADAESKFNLDLMDFVDQHYQQMLDSWVDSYRKTLPGVLAASEEFLSQTELHLKLDETSHAKEKRRLLNLEIEYKRKGLKGEIDTATKASGARACTFERILAPSTEPLTESSPSGSKGYNLLASASGWMARLLSPLPTDYYILTAERAAIQLFSHELAIKRTELVDSLLLLKSSARRRLEAGEALVEALEQRASRYPLAIREGLLMANDLANYKRQTSPYAPFADHLERQLLGGALRIDEDGQMQFHPEGSNSSLSLHLSSSSVKSLSGLAFFLRHIAKKGQFLIIDEPELNLHPDNQRRVARVLARLSQAGIKVLISTHSDYFIRELNNLIMLSADKDGTLRQRHGYEKEETLAPDRIGAYLFNAERSHPIEVKQTGIEVETIDREINNLNSVSQDIYFSLFGNTGA